MCNQTGTMIDNVESAVGLPDPRNRIASEFNGKTFFISGGTGFMGKVLLEKLLRSCTGLKKIYLLIRSKKGKTAQERLNQIFQGVLFDKVRGKYGDSIFNKVAAINGDVTEIDLGISKEDRKRLAEEVQVIYHCAATIRFDMDLKTAILINVRGTKFMLDLAKEMKNLTAFVHISTAYCHLNEKVLYEKSYPPPSDPHLMIKVAEWMDEDVITTIQDKLLGTYPNTYAYTKALGEGLIDEQMDNLPVIILRPPVVIPIWIEPVPGWTDNINGPTGLLIAAGKGILRSMYCNQEAYADYLPVDIFINATISATWYYITHRSKRYFNFTSSAEYQITHQDVIEIGRNIIENKVPLNGVVWYPGGGLRKSRLIHNVEVIFFHYLPAIVLDFFIWLSGNKPVLWRVQQRITKGFEVFEYYANNQWEFNNEESMELRSILNDVEKEDFKCDGNGIDYDEYFTNCVHAARLYILNEPEETLPAARRHMFIMWCVDRIVKFLLIFGFFYLLYKHLLLPIFT